MLGGALLFHTQSALGMASERRFRFFLWNDMHVRAPEVVDRPPGYPNANEKAAWAAECAAGQGGIEKPDFVLSAGDLIDGEIPDLAKDFAYLKANIVDKLPVPFLPCVGNHENGQGEGSEEAYRAYDACFGPGWRNYVFTFGGVGFVVLDTSGAHREADEVTTARNAFAKRALMHLDGMPIFVVTHVPLVPMREEKVLQKSFGFPSWRVADKRLLDIVNAHNDYVIAVLSGHLHLTGMQHVNDIVHFTDAGTASYPSEFAAIDVFPNHVEIRLQSAPEPLQSHAGDIHGAPRFTTDFTDVEHPTHEAYVHGNPDERSIVIRIKGRKRVDRHAPTELYIHREIAPGQWRTERK
jgi:hypothetical protein